MKTRKGKTVYELYEVFTPASPARATFIERSSINTKLVNALMTPGKQLIIYGHTGSGKTTLLINKLDQVYEKHIITRCMVGMTFENLLMHGFAELDKHYIEKTDNTKKTNIGIQLGAEYKIIKAQLSASTERSTTVTSKPIMPPLLTAQFLVKFYGELNCCWVLEDFHKIAPEEKVKAAQIMKVFVDSATDYPRAKLIAIGAVNTGRDVINYDKEMRHRVSQIHVLLMTEPELNAIIDSGEEKLNIRFGSDVREAIVKASSGLAAICHQLCLNCCNYKEIIETSNEIVKIDEDALSNAFETYVEENEDSIKQDYEEAIRVENGYGDLPELILTSIAKYGKEEISCRNINKRMDVIGNQRNVKFDPKHILELLAEMQTEKRGSVLSYNEITDRYSFINPFMRVYVQCIVKNEFSPDTKNHTDKKDLDTLIQQMVDKMHKIYYEGAEDDNEDDSDVTAENYSMN